MFIRYTEYNVNCASLFITLIFLLLEQKKNSTYSVLLWMIACVCVCVCVYAGIKMKRFPLSTDLPLQPLPLNGRVVSETFCLLRKTFKEETFERCVLL